jgi:outer membrane receptor protein involved in Fe transport
MKSHLLTSVCLFAIMGGSLGAIASNDTDQDDDIDEIIVVGQKGAKTLREVTTSVDVVSGVEIEREPLNDLIDVITRIPNVTSSFGEQGFAIRGVDQRGVGGSGLTLTVYVDDSPLGDQTTFFGPTSSWDLSQVEVYRGPQSTNFGRNTLAGAIYVRTQDPTYETEVKARAEIGNNGALWLAAAGGGAIIDDKLAFRVSADYRESDGFIRNTLLNEDADALELWNTRIKFLFEPFENLKIISTTSYSENFAGEDALIPFGDPATAPNINANNIVREVAQDLPGREGTESFIQSLNITWDINENWSVQSIFSYQDTDYVRIEDFDRTAAPLATLNRAGTDETFTEELRIRYNDDHWSVALGGYYADIDPFLTDTFIVPGSFVNPAIPNSIGIDRTTTTSGKTKNYAVFLDGEYHLNDQIDLLFGFRWDDEDQSDIQIRDVSIVGEIPAGFEFLSTFEGTSTEATDASFNAFLPKGGIRYRASEDWTLSFVAQRAYRAGGAEINFADGSIAEFDPEYLWNFELASRASFLDGRLNWNTNIYYSDWSDQQVSIPLPPPFAQFFQTVNAGSSELYGFETDISYEISNEINIYAGAGYSVAKFRDFPNGTFNPDLPAGLNNQENFDGNRFPFAPRFSFNGGIDYRSNNGLFAGIDVSYQSSSFNLIENDPNAGTDARTLVNARAGYQINENVALSVQARNLFNEDYFTNFNRNPASNFANVGDRRLWSVRLDVTF